MSSEVKRSLVETSEESKYGAINSQHLVTSDDAENSPLLGQPQIKDDNINIRVRVVSSMCITYIYYDTDTDR